MSTLYLSQNRYIFDLRNQLTTSNFQHTRLSTSTYIQQPTCNTQQPTLNNQHWTPNNLSPQHNNLIPQANTTINHTHHLTQPSTTPNNKTQFLSPQQHSPNNKHHPPPTITNTHSHNLPHKNTTTKHPNHKCLFTTHKPSP